MKEYNDALILSMIVHIIGVATNQSFSLPLLLRERLRMRERERERERKERGVKREKDIVHTRWDV